MSTHLLMAMDEIKTITEAILQNEQGGEAVLCNCLEIQPSIYSVFGREV